MSPAASGIPGPSGHDHPAFPSSFRSASPLAGQVLAQDIAECTDDDFDPADDQIDGEHSHHFMYRRPSGVAYGAARPAFNPNGLDEPILTPLERKQSRDAERSLLRDNHVLPPKHNNKSQSIPARIYRKIFSTKVPVEEYEGESEDDSPLLSRDDDLDYGTRSRRQRPVPEGEEDVDEQWEEAITTGRIRTTWQREAKTVLSYCGPLIVTFFLQYSINVAGIFAVGRIGTIELGAISCKSAVIPKYYAKYAATQRGKTKLTRRCRVQWPTCRKPSPAWPPSRAWRRVWTPSVPRLTDLATSIWSACSASAWRASS
jgi:MATE family multidrug resistance protein